MKVIITTNANKRNTPPTISFINRLSYFRCMKKVSTIKTFIDAIKSATPTEIAPR
jgi:hypothetical protein